MMEYELRRLLMLCIDKRTEDLTEDEVACLTENAEDVLKWAGKLPIFFLRRLPQRSQYFTYCHCYRALELEDLKENYERMLLMQGDKPRGWSPDEELQVEALRDVISEKEDDLPF